MAALADGGFIIVWTDGSLIGGDASGVAVKAQRFDGSGSQVGGEFLVNTTTSGNQSSPAVAVLPSGRFVVTWTDASASGGDASGNAVRGQLFDADGTTVGAEFLVNTAVDGNQGPAVVAELPNGGFVVAWTDASGQGGDTSSTGIKAQIFDGNGAKIGGEILANTTTLGTQSGASVSSLASGGFAIAWTDTAGAHFQRFDAGGAKVGSEQLVNGIPGSSFFVNGITIASVGSGFVVTWAQADSPPVSGQPITFDVREQRFDASGTKVGGEALVNTTVAGSQSNPDVHALPNGGYLVTWQGPGAGASGINVYGQAFDASGAKVGSEFLLGTTLDGSQTGGKVTALASGDILLAWTDGSGLGGDTSSVGVKAQLLTATTDAPSDIALSNTHVSETSVENLPVATLSSTSSALFNAFTYSIVTDSSGGAFGIEGDTLVVLDSSKLDFETQPNLSVTIRTTDLNGGTHDESFALTVTDAAIEARYSAGPEFAISDDTTGFNTPLAIVPLTSGGFLSVTWDSLIGVTDKVHGRIFDAAGNPATGEFEIAMPFTGSSFGGAAALPGGGFVVAYRGASIGLGGGSNGFPIRAQIYDAAGHAVGGAILASTTNNDILMDPRVATLASGGFVLTWTLPKDEGDDPGASFPSQIRGQIFTASGTPVGGEFRANTTTVGAQHHSHVEALPGGGFVVTWQDSTTQGVEGQIFNAVGSKVGGEFTTVAHQPDLGSSQLTVLASGNLLVSWSELIDDSGSVPIYAIDAQLLSPAGAAIGGPLDLALGTDSAFHIAAAPGGGFVLGLSAVILTTLDANDDDAWVQMFNNAGAPVGDPFLIAATRDDDSIAGMTTLDNGAFAFILSRGFVENSSSTSDAFARIVSLVGPAPPISGTEGNDVLADTAFADQINGLAGNDIINVHSGHDRVDGGAGSDTLVVDYSAATAAVTVSGLQMGTGGGAGWQGDISDVSAGGSHDVLFDNIERLDLTTGSGDDLVVGIGGVNIIHAGLGNDRLSSGAGDDVLDGGAGADTMAGGAGNDVYFVDNAGDVVTENAGDGTDEVRTTLASYTLAASVENLTGLSSSGQDLMDNALSNVIVGGSGNDRIFDEAGATGTLRGNDGDDYLYFRRYFGTTWTSGRIEGGNGNDTLLFGSFTSGAAAADMGAGDDSIYLEKVTGSLQLTLGAGRDMVDIGALTDGLSGSVAVTDFAAGAGGDTIRWATAFPFAFGAHGYTEGSNPFAEGYARLLQSGADTLLQISRNADGNFTTLLTFQNRAPSDFTADNLGWAPAPTQVAGTTSWGTSSNDWLIGSNAATIFNLGQGGDDTVTAGRGNDIIYFGGALTGLDHVDGGAGTRDVLVLQGDYTNLLLDAQNFANIEFISVQSGSITRFGDDGTHSYDYSITTSDVNVAAGQTLQINGQSLLAGEDLTVDGSAETNGKFLIDGGHGVDTLKGGAGNDIFFFEGDRWGASDTVLGGAGNDAVVISGVNGLNHIEFGETSLTGIEAISVNNRFAADLTATPSYEFVLHNGNVTAGGSLIVNGSSLKAGQSISIDGHLVIDGALSLDGGAANDTLIGGAKNDVLYAAGGADTLTGGGGADIFQYRSISDSTVAASDHILDFTSGTDKIDLHFIDANTNLDGDQAFSFIGSAAFSHTASELRATFDAVSHLWSIQGDVDGDSIADFQVFVSVGDGHAIGASDFQP